MSYTSPDAEYVVDIISEDQLSNDPDPFWQHISIRNSMDSVPVVPGNLYCVSAYKEPTVTWTNSDTVIIELIGRYGQSFRKEDIKSLKWKDVYIKMIVNPFDENKP